jgi:hypothetical protein
LINHTFAPSATSSLKVREFDQRHEFSVGEQSASAAVDELEHRLSAVGKKIDE